MTVKKVRALKFNGNTITFLRWGSLWILPAKLLGQALGYSENGDKLANLISSTWKKEFKYVAVSTFNDLGAPEHLRDTKLEAILLKKNALQEFKDLSAQKSGTASQLLILTMPGVLRVLSRSRAKMAQSFKNFLVANGQDLLKGLSVDRKLPTNEVGGRADLAINQTRTALDDFLQVFHTMTKKGLISKKDQKQVMKNTLDTVAARMAKEAGLTHFLTDGKTPPTNTKALAKNAMAVPEGNFKVVSTTSPYHPDYQDWLPASDIGAPWLLKGDLVKKFCKAFCLARGIDLPNNDAKKFVESNGGNFPQPDDKGFIIFKPNHASGIALYMQMEGNQMNWRNYWSPAAVQDIRGLIAIDKGSPIPNLAEIVRLEIAGNIFREIEVGGSSIRSDMAENRFRDECKKKNVRFGDDLTFMKDFLDSKAVNGGPLIRWKNKLGKMFLYTKITDTHIDENVWEKSEPAELPLEEVIHHDPGLNYAKSDQTALPEGQKIPIPVNGENGEGSDAFHHRIDG